MRSQKVGLFLLASALAAVASVEASQASALGQTAGSGSTNYEIAKTLGLPRSSAVIRRRDVQRDVSLSADQVVAVAKLIKGTKLTSAALDALDTNVLAILSNEQTVRLRQIQIQLAGWRAVFDATVQTAIVLTSSQKTEVATLATQVSAGKVKTGYAVDSTVAEILTAKQKAALAALDGPAFGADLVP